MVRDAQRPIYQPQPMQMPGSNRYKIKESVFGGYELEQSPFGNVRMGNGLF